MSASSCSVGYWTPPNGKPPCCSASLFGRCLDQVVRDQRRRDAERQAVVGPQHRHPAPLGVTRAERRHQLPAAAPLTEFHQALALLQHRHDDEHDDNEQDQDPQADSLSRHGCSPSMKKTRPNPKAVKCPDSSPIMGRRKMIVLSSGDIPEGAGFR